MWEPGGLDAVWNMPLRVAKTFLTADAAVAEIKELEPIGAGGILWFVS